MTRVEWKFLFRRVYFSNEKYFSNDRRNLWIYKNNKCEFRINFEIRRMWNFARWTVRHVRDDISSHVQLNW